MMKKMSLLLRKISTSFTSSSSFTSLTSRTLTTAPTSTTSSAITTRGVIEEEDLGVNYFDLQYFGADTFTDTTHTPPPAATATTTAAVPSCVAAPSDKQDPLSAVESYFVGESEDSLSLFESQYFHRIR